MLDKLRRLTAPHYISDDKSDMRGIKSGWYVIEDDRNLSSGPFSSLVECVTRQLQVPCVSAQMWLTPLSKSQH